MLGYMGCASAFSIFPLVFRTSKVGFHPIFISCVSQNPKIMQSFLTAPTT